MSKPLFALSFGFVLILFATLSATAQSSRACGPRAQVLERLATVYGETRQSIGLRDDNTVMEVFAAGPGGSWTITVTTAGGLTCLLAAGESFERIDTPQARPGEPA